MLLALVGTARADQIPIEFDASVTGISNYLFRGASLGPAGLFNDASLTATLTDEWTLSGDIWNYTKIDGGVRNGEFDYTATVGYAPSAWPVSFSAGYRFYDREGFLGLDTQELFFGVTADTLPWTPSLTAYYDFDRLPGTYVSLDAGNSWELKPDVTFDFGGHIGLDFARGVDTFNDASTGGSVTWTFLPDWRVYGGVDLVVPSHQVGLYGARFVPYAGVGYNRSW